MPSKPGGGGGSADPTNYEYLADERLLTNGNITRLPTTQRGWSSFVLELNKWIKNETGAFDPTFDGFSSDPGQILSQGPSVWWQRYGQVVQLEFWFSTGTSDGTVFEIENLPENLRPKQDTLVVVGGLWDNGAAITEPQSINIKSDGVIEFYSDVYGSGWTASSGKGYGGAAPLSITYLLRNPSKL